MFDVGLRVIRSAIIAAGLTGLTSGCVVPEASERVPESLVDRAMVSDYRNIRFYSDDVESLRVRTHNQ